MKENRTSDIKLFTLAEVGEILQLSHRTLLTYMKNQTIKGIKIGSQWRVSEEELKAFIEGKAGK